MKNKRLVTSLTGATITVVLCTLPIAGCPSQPVNCGVNGTYDPMLQSCTYPPPVDSGVDASASEAGGVDATSGVDALDGGSDTGGSSDASTDGPPDVSINRALPAPRQIAPLSTSIATSQTPTFHWSLGNGLDGAAVDVCKDRAFTMQCQTIRATGTSGQAISPLSPGVWFWRARGRMGMTEGAQASTTWEVFVRGRSAANDTSWGSVPDFNGDGIADIVVGESGMSPPADAGFHGPGEVYVYSGAMSGLPSAPTQTLLSPSETGGTWGGAIANAGDVNGDGYADFVGITSGGAFFANGSPQGLGTQTSGTISPSGGTATITILSVAAAGDVNDDGYGDVVVISMSTESGFGPDAAVMTNYAVNVYSGSSGGIATQSPNVALTLPATSAPHALVAADLNGDGYDDVVVSWPTVTGSGTQYVCVYNGAGTGITRSASTTLTAPLGYSGFGSFLADGGDLNGDGYADLVVGPTLLEVCVGSVCHADPTGGVLVYYGHASGIATTADVSLTNAAGTGNGHGSLGESAAGGGDLNGDGYDDLLVGGTSSGAEGPLVFTFPGGASGVASSPTLTFATPGTPTGATNFYTSIAPSGDVTGDGLPDVVFSAMGGSLYGYYNSNAGFSASPSVMLPGGSPVL